MKTLGILVAICATLYLLNWVRIDTNRAMEACQQKHSYDTCARNLLR